MKTGLAGPRVPFLLIRVTEREARHVLELLESIDKKDELAPPGAIQACESVAWRIRHAKVRFPNRRAR